jgi:NRPS condensation-like uncharacterized protein
MTYFDAVIGALRPCFYGALSWAAGYVCEYKGLLMPYLIGFLVMLTYYYLLKIIFYLAFGLTHIGISDELQLFDKSTNKVIITATMYFERFNADLMLERLKARMLIHKQLRSTFVKVLDQYYLRELTPEQIEIAAAKSFVKIEKCYQGYDIEEESDLTRFLEREVTIPFQDGGFYFRIFALQNYSEKESVLLIKFHHALADGMSLVGLCASL